MQFSDTDLYNRRYCSKTLRETACWAIAIMVCHVPAFVRDLCSVDSIRTVCALALPQNQPRCRQYASAILYQILEQHELRYHHPDLVGFTFFLECNSFMELVLYCPCTFNGWDLYVMIMCNRGQCLSTLSESIWFLNILVTGSRLPWCYIVTSTWPWRRSSGAEAMRMIADNYKIFYNNKKSHFHLSLTVSHLPEVLQKSSDFSLTYGQGNSILYS